MTPRSYISIGVVLLMIVLFQQGTTYAGRVDDRKAKVAACMRSVKDRKDLVKVTTALDQGFKATDAKFGGPLTPERKAAEAKIRQALAGFTVRSQIDCYKAFPAPPVIQFQ